MGDRIDIGKAPTRFGASYPPPFDTPCLGRKRWRLGDAAGLTQFGVNLLRLPPGQWSSQRHWHEAEDEFVYVLEGELTLVTEAGETLLRPGDCAGFKAGDADGHKLENRTGREAVVLEVGSRKPGEGAVHYPDIDLELPKHAMGYTDKAGLSYGRR